MALLYNETSPEAGLFYKSKNKMPEISEQKYPDTSGINYMQYLSSNDEAYLTVEPGATSLSG